MMMKKLGLPIILLFFGMFFAFHTSHAQEWAVDEKIEEVYQSFASQLTEDQATWIGNCLDRCTVINDTEVPESFVIEALSEIPLLDKYGASLSYDASYESTDFNPLKYMINFHKKKDQFFRIGSTPYVLKVAKTL